MFAEDIIGEILSFVPFIRKLQLGHLCKEWLMKSKLNIILDTSEISTIKGTPNLISFIKIFYIKWKVKSIETLIINSCRQKITLELLKILNKHSKIKKIVLKNSAELTYKTSNLIWKNLPYLESFEAHEIYQSYDIISDNLKELKILKYRSDNIDSIKTPNLEHLTLSTDKTIDIKDIFNLFPKLKYLCVSVRQYNLEFNTFTSIQNKSLKVLKLTNLCNINFKILNHILTNFTNIEDIEVNIYDTSTSTFTIKSSILRKIKLSNPETYDFPPINLFIECPKLETCILPTHFVVNSFVFGKLKQLNITLKKWIDAIDAEKVFVHFYNSDPDSLLDINIVNHNVKELSITTNNNLNTVNIDCCKLVLFKTIHNKYIDKLKINCKNLRIFDVTCDVRSLNLTSNSISTLELDDNIFNIENINIPGLKNLYINSYISSLYSLYDNCQNITNLKLDSYKCKTIDFSNFKMLNVLNISNITSQIDIKHPQLHTLLIQGISHNINIDLPNLKVLSIKNGNMKALDLTKCLSLYSFKIFYCKMISELILNKVNFIKILSCNELKSIDIDTDDIFKSSILDCTNLEKVNIKCNKIGKITINTHCSTYINANLIGKLRILNKPIFFK